MIFILILAFLRESTGATFFFLHYTNENHELVCNISASQNQTCWWFGNESLLQFQQVNYNTKGNTLTCPVNEPNRTNRSISITSSHGGGIFACRALMENKTSDQHPLFSNLDHCRNFDFFIVAIINGEADKKIESITEPSVKTMSVKEKSNLSLPCAFKLKNGSDSFAAYWIKGERTCLHSVSNEGFQFQNLHNFSYDINCCVDTEIKKRRFNHPATSGPENQNQSHSITITNVTTSDSGVYFCIVTVYSRRHLWKIVTNMSVEVAPQSGTELSLTEKLQISLGVIGSILVIGGIIVFLFWKKNRKGKPSESHQRDRTTTEMEGEECSPYAISTRNDICGNEVVYSLAMSPGVNPKGASSLQDGKAVSGMPAGGNVEAVYAVVDKRHS